MELEQFHVKLSKADLAECSRFNPAIFVDQTEAQLARLKMLAQQAAGQNLRLVATNKTITEALYQALPDQITTFEELTGTGQMAHLMSDQHQSVPLTIVVAGKPVKVTAGHLMIHNGQAELTLGPLPPKALRLPWAKPKAPPKAA
jgi:hypothetical protein